METVFLQYLFISFICIYNNTKTYTNFNNFSKILLNGLVENRSEVVKVFRAYLDALKAKEFSEKDIQFSTDMLENILNSLTQTTGGMTNYSYKENFFLVTNELKAPIRMQRIEEMQLCGQILNSYILCCYEYKEPTQKDKVCYYTFKIPKVVLNCPCYILEHTLFNHLILSTLNNFLNGKLEMLNLGLIYDKYSNISYKQFYELKRGQIAVLLNYQQYKNLIHLLNEKQYDEIKYPISTVVAKHFKHYITRGDDCDNAL